MSSEQEQPRQQDSKPATGAHSEPAALAAPGPGLEASPAATPAATPAGSPEATPAASFSPDSGPGPELNAALAPLAFLLGCWEGAGVVGYPTITSAHFGQELSFRHNGKPYLIYASRTWLLDEEGRPGRPLAMETGFWRPASDAAVEVLLAHPTGITEIYLGTISGTRIEMATDAVVRTSTAKEVTAGRRLYGLIGADLAYAFDLAAVGQPLQAHASAQLKRVS